MQDIVLFLVWTVCKTRNGDPDKGGFRTEYGSFLIRGRIHFPFYMNYNSKKSIIYQIIVITKLTHNYNI